jgi:hypothetical protein
MRDVGSEGGGAISLTTRANNSCSILHKEMEEILQSQIGFFLWLERPSDDDLVSYRSTGRKNIKNTQRTYSSLALSSTVSLGVLKSPRFP